MNDRFHVEKALNTVVVNNCCKRAIRSSDRKQNKEEQSRTIPGSEVHDPIRKEPESRNS